MSDKVPDLCEPVLAIRGWFLYNRRGMPCDPPHKLRSMTFINVEWPTDRPLIAQICDCQSIFGGRLSNFIPPLCGIQAMKPLRRTMMMASASVIGVVALWGKVEEHQFGYRGELAYPILIHSVDPRYIDPGYKAYSGINFRGYFEMPEAWGLDAVRQARHMWPEVLGKLDPKWFNGQWKGELNAETLR